MTTLEALLHTPLAQATGWALIHLTWQAALVALALALVTALVEKSTPSIRYAMAWSALAAAFVLPLATGAIMYVRLSEEAALAPPPASARTHSETLTPSILIPTGVHHVADEARDSLKVTFVSPSAMLGRVLPWIVALWFIGVALLSSRVLFGFLYTSRLVKYSTDGNARWQNAVRRISRAMRIEYAVRVVESAKVSVPTVIGWIKPVIVLPASALTGLSPEQFETILAHELAHIRRHDFILNVIQVAIETLLFYHPAVWWISRQVRIERENCCDDLAVAVCGDAVAYAHALTKLELLRAEAPQVAVASTGGSLLSRIKRLLGHGDERWQLTPSFVSGAVLLVGVAALVAVPLRVLASEGKTKAPEKSSFEISVVAPSAKSTSSTSSSAAVADGVAGGTTDDDAFSDAMLDSVDLAFPEPPELPAMAAMAPDAPPAIPGCPSSPHESAAVAPVPAAPGVPAAPPAPAIAKVARLSEIAFPDVDFEMPDVDADINFDGPVNFALSNGHGRKHVNIENPDRKVDFDHLDAGDRKLIEDLEISDAWLRDMKAAGYNGITRRELASARVLAVTGEYARALNAAYGTKLTVRQLTRSRMMGVTADYVKSVRATNYANFTPEEMAKMRMMAVTAKGLLKLQSQGKTGLSAKEIIKQLMFGDAMAALSRSRAEIERSRVELQRIPVVTRESVRRSMGITPEYEAEMKASGMASLSEHDLMRLRISGVTGDYVKSLKAAGFKNLSVEQIARLKMFGVDASYLSELTKSGYSNLSVDDLIRLRHSGIDAEFLRQLRALKESDAGR